MPRDVNLDLDLVRTFVTIAETRSFTRTGERLGRSQSAISLQVRRLEERLGVKLLARDPRRVGLTEAGEAFLPKARRLLRVNDEILAELTGEDLEGEVRLTDESGHTETYVAGDTFVIPKGFKGVWETVKPVRKFFAVYEGG